MTPRVIVAPQPVFVPGEVDDIPFRFGKEMRADETIATVSVDCTSVGSVVDATPLDRLTAPYQIDGTQVVQRYQAADAGMRHVVVVNATMSSGRRFTGAVLCIVVPLEP